MSGELGRDGVCERFESGDEGMDDDAAVTVDSGLEVASIWRLWDAKSDKSGW